MPCGERIDLHRVSQASLYLMVEFEISERSGYQRRYRWPTRPGVPPGSPPVSVTTAATRRPRRSGGLGWVTAVGSGGGAGFVAGVTGVRAQAALVEIMNKVDVPWDAALAAFTQHGPAKVSRHGGEVAELDKLSSDGKARW